MSEPAAIDTPRLRLRLLAPTDAADVQAAASVREIADTMISVPHPYPPGEAERYVERQRAEFALGRAVTFAVEEQEGGTFYGVVEVRDIDREHEQAELSFWLAPAAWGRGYMSEVVPAVVRYGFEGLGLNRLYAFHMTRNPASGRVLAKGGFAQEGVLRQRVRKDGRYEDVAVWAVLRDEWLPASSTAASARASI